MQRNKTTYRLIAFVICLSLLSTTAFAISGVWHNPFGINDLYDVEVTERFPRNPVAGDIVYIKANTWPIEYGQSVWVSYTKNGVHQQDVGADWKYNEGNNTYWEAAIGPFSKGDEITYTVYADKDSSNTKQVGPFDFSVTDWEKAQSVSLASNEDGHIVLDVTPDSGTFRPELGLSFPTANTLRFQLSPKGNIGFASGIAEYSVVENGTSIVISTSKLQVTIEKSPYGIEIFDLEKQEMLSENGNTGNELSWLTDGENVVSGFKEGYSSPNSEQFYGFGERYNGIEKRGELVDTYVFNQYRDQRNRTYMAMPFFVSSKGYGIYLNSTYYSQFDMANSVATQYKFTVENSGSSALLDYYFIAGNPDEVVSEYAQISGLPSELPKWAFGLWMSANEWDRQSEVLGAVDMATNLDIPATVVVLEQWSDENTFYIWNDSTYTAVPGSQVFSGSDFTYSSKWPNPAAMVDDIHNNGMKVLLWQIPVQKYTPYSWEQKDNDEAYMIQQGYAVGDGNGGEYRIPESGWFGNSLLLDFTNSAAVDWWMSKRAYLFDDIGIDGVKTDGGEMVWGIDNSFSNGMDALEMRNAYPNYYIDSYFNYVEDKTSEGMTFSRSGTSGVQKTGVFWAGDQQSNFSAFRDALSAGLSAGISGIPYWGWDLAGFTGDFPTSELFKRSTTMSTFSPIIQFHSEKSNPSLSEERSPWNVQSRTGDTSIVPMFQKHMNVRMNILPYIYSEAQKSAFDGTPMMRAMMIDFPQDENVYALDEQYMFGRNLLVAPIMYEGQTVKELYLPEGEWIDFFHNAMTAGGGEQNYYADVNSIPVYVRNGSILPLNLNENFEIGGSIGNDVDNYTNLVFRVYPSGESTYTLSHSDKSTMTVSASENFDEGTVTIGMPVSSISAVVQVFGTAPSVVTVNNTTLQQVNSLSSFNSANNAFYYSWQEKLTYIKSSEAGQKQIVLSDVYQAPYEAEHAQQINVSVNTNHAGYSGDGFVDQFAEVGDATEFTVYSSSSQNGTIYIRYSAGTENAQRNVYVNGNYLTTVALPKTTNWDSWGVASVAVPLNAGQNTIKIAYDYGNYAGLNLDCISMR